MSTENAYLSYQSMVSQANESMAALSSVCTSLGLDQFSETLNTTREHMKNKLFSVGIMGEFRRGKSTVINALLGQEIVPSDIVPTSATLNYIRWDTRPGVTVHFKNGSEQQIGIDELPNFVTKITPEAEQMAATVADAVVHYPCRFCQNGVQIVDTPGLNDDERMNQIAEQVIPTLDAIIMVLVPDSPFGMSEAEFVRTKVMTSDLGRIIFAVNKIDNVRKKDRERLLNDIRKRIRDSVLEKLAAIYGEASEEYKEAESKLGEIRIFGISARDALEGRLDDDEELIEKSGFPEFETALSKLLTEERGLLELISPVNTVLAVAKEAQKAIDMRRNAINLSQQEVEQIAAEGMAAVEKERQSKSQAVAATRNHASALYADLLPEVDAAYKEAESEVMNEIEQISISSASVQNDKLMAETARGLEKELENRITQALSSAAERLMVRIENQVSCEIRDLQKVSEEMTLHLTEIQRKLAPRNDAMFDWGVVAFDALTNSFGLFGLGGFMTGWKENGVSGALVGGAAGFLAGVGTMELIANVALAAGIAGGFVIALPMVVIGGAAAAFGGKAAVKAVFKKKIGEKNVERLKGELSAAVKSGMQEIRQQRALETWLKTTTGQVYNAVADQLDQELEASLTAFESTLSTLRLDKQKKEGELAKTLEELDRCERRLDKIAGTIAPVKAKLADALNG